MITASSTTTTDNNFKPPLTESSQLAGLSRSTDTASQYINTNDGRVKPTKAAIPPASPPLCKPTANQSWLEPVPGKICLKNINLA